MIFYIGIDLGASHVKAVAVTAEGELLGEKEIPFDQAISKDWASKVQLAVVALEGEHGGRAAGMGLSAPGVAAKDRKSIAFLPGRLEGLEGFNWTHHLEREQLVPVLNDGQAALLGEVWRGAAKGSENVIMLTLGTGVGAGDGSAVGLAVGHGVGNFVGLVEGTFVGLFEGTRVGCFVGLVVGDVLGATVQRTAVEPLS